jgi:hypothetical protein
VSVGTISFLLSTGATTLEFVIFVPGMLFPALGLALGSHLIIGDNVPPTPWRLIAGAVTGALAGALLSLLGLTLGATLANLFGLKRSEGAEWAAIFLPSWIFFSGGSALFARYLVWKLLGDQTVVAVGAGAVGALVGDSLMTLMLTRPFTTGPHFLHAPLVMTAGFGALVAAGLAWAERKVSDSSPEATRASSANDTPEQ